MRKTRNTVTDQWSIEPFPNEVGFGAGNVDDDRLCFDFGVPRGLPHVGPCQPPPNKQGQRTLTHETYKIFTGQPTYTEVKERFLKVANGKAGDPLCSSTSLIAAEQKPI